MAMSAANVISQIRTQMRAQHNDPTLEPSPELTKLVEAILDEIKNAEITGTVSGICADAGLPLQNGQIATASIE